MMKSFIFYCNTIVTLMMTEHSLVGIDLAEVQMMTLGLKKYIFPQQLKMVEKKQLST